MRGGGDKEGGGRKGGGVKSREGEEGEEGRWRRMKGEREKDKRGCREE